MMPSTSLRTPVTDAVRILPRDPVTDAVFDLVELFQGYRFSEEELQLVDFKLETVTNWVRGLRRLVAA
jgi:hypothetical protein